MKKLAVSLFCLFFTLLLFAGKWDEKLFDAVKSGNLKAVEEAIKKGADVNAKDNDDLTALMFAAKNGHKDICELLISKGADVNAKNKNGKTPLDLAKEKGDRRICDLLASKGAKAGPTEKVPAGMEAALNKKAEKPIENAAKRESKAAPEGSGSVVAPLAQTAPPKNKAGIELAQKKPDKPVVELAQNATPAKKLSPEQGNGATQTQAAKDPVGVKPEEFQEAIDTNQKMIEKKEVMGAKFDGALGQNIFLEEWVIQVARVPPGFSGTDVYNKLTNVPDGAVGSKSIFLTNSIEDLVTKYHVVDHELVAGPFAVRNPNKPNETVLVLATRDWLVFYALNTKKDQKGDEVKTMEMFANPLKELDIGKKPMLIFETGFDEKGGWINAIVTDENWIEKVRNGEKVKFASVVIYPNDSRPGISKITRPEIFEIVP